MNINLNWPTAFTWSSPPVDLCGCSCRFSFSLSVRTDGITLFNTLFFSGGRWHQNIKMENKWKQKILSKMLAIMVLSANCHSLRPGLKLSSAKRKTVVPFRLFAACCKDSKWSVALPWCNRVPVTWMDPPVFFHSLLLQNGSRSWIASQSAVHGVKCSALMKKGSKNIPTMHKSKDHLLFFHTIEEHLAQAASK